MNQYQIHFFGRGFAPDPAEVPYDAPQDPLVGWGGRHPSSFASMPTMSVLSSFMPRPMVNTIATSQTPKSFPDVERLLEVIFS